MSVFARGKALRAGASRTRRLYGGEDSESSVVDRRALFRVGANHYEYAFPGLTPRALFLRRFAAHVAQLQRHQLEDWAKLARALKPSQGCSTILPSMWLFSMCSWAARAADKGNVQSTTGFRRPAKTCFNTSCSSPIVPM